MKKEELVKEMMEFMLTRNGVGLAASQIDQRDKVFVIHPLLARKHSVPEVYTNPVITSKSAYVETDEEGCLSHEGKTVRVPRAYRVNLKSDEGEFYAKGFLARVYQHEVDHLTGRCILDYEEKVESGSSTEGPPLTDVVGA